MSLQHSNSIVLVSSYDSTASEFGTGFVIHRAGDTTYVLTSAHVVRDIGEQYLRVDGFSASVFKASTPEEFDIAVLEVKGLLDKLPLLLSETGEEGNHVTILGFYKPSSSFTPELRPIHGSLADQGMPTSKCGSDRTVNWHLKIHGEHVLKRGYSGSPVLDKVNNRVLGVIRSEENQGRQGTAISVVALKKIWTDAPLSWGGNDVYSTPKFTMNKTSLIQVFLFYADQDEKYKKQFEEMCLSPLEGRGIIEVWSKNKIRPGENRKQVIEHNLNNASIVLLLISRDFMSAYYKNTNDLKYQILRIRRSRETVKVIPILMRAANWEREFSDLQSLPRNSKFVNDRAWGGQDLALYQIAKELEEEIN